LDLASRKKYVPVFPPKEKKTNKQTNKHNSEVVKIG
jgi:hypothetical protein